jgi:hypothetical protein
LVSGIYGDQGDAQRKLNEYDPRHVPELLTNFTRAEGAFDNMSRMNSKCVKVLKAFKTLVDTVGGPLANVSVIIFQGITLIPTDV